MKHFYKFYVAVMTLININSYAQKDNNLWALSIGINAVDTRTSAGGENKWLDNHFSQMYDVGNNWNIKPYTPYISVARYVGNNFSVSLQGSINKIDKFVVFDPTNPEHNSTGYVVTNPGGLMYYSIDTNVKYSFMPLINSEKIDPSLNVGGGLTFLGNYSYGTINFGAGLTFWFNENIGLAFVTDYKWSPVQRTDEYGDKRNLPGDSYLPWQPSYFQHTIGIVFNTSTLFRQSCFCPF